MPFDFTLLGIFSLTNQHHYFGGSPILQYNPNIIVITFPVEGWDGSAAVAIQQLDIGHIAGQVYGSTANPEKAWNQALACLSLDIDGEGWLEVGKRDTVIGNLQQKYLGLRPILFHSPYEAAAGFIIGHRITIKQKQSLMKIMSEQLGDKIEINGQVFHAFPKPQTILTLTGFKGLSPQKIERLHGIAEAALNGMLDRDKLRSMPIEEALMQLKSLPGVGPFFAEGILFRGAGVVDEITNDDLTPYAVQKAYQLAALPNRKELLTIAESWKPYRMWATVLLHVWLRREVGLPSKRTFTGR